MVSRFENVHRKRINEIRMEGSVLYSCSNDGAVRLFDVKGNRLIKQFNTNNEMFSLAKSQDLLVAGSQAKIYFW